MTYVEMLKVFTFMQAYLNGESVQYNSGPSHHPVWNDVPLMDLSITFSWDPSFDYRIKPAAREVWLVWIDNSRHPSACCSKEQALQIAQRPHYAGKKISVQHVIEEVK